VLFTDCCSNIVGYEPPNRRVPAEWEVFKQLFFQSTGLVDITASEVGTSSWGNNANGGMFTRVLCRNLCERVNELDMNGDGQVAWNEFAGHLRHQTNAIFVATRDAARPQPDNPNHISNFESQLPQAFYLADRGRWNFYCARSATNASGYTAELNQVTAGVNGMVRKSPAQAIAYARQALPILTPVVEEAYSDAVVAWNLAEATQADSANIEELRKRVQIQDQVRRSHSDLMRRYAAAARR
jgi:hypothetical protein